MRKLLVTPLLTCALVAAACSGGDGSGAGPDSPRAQRLAAAARAVADARTFRFEGTVLDPAGDEMPVKGVADTGVQGEGADAEVQPFTMIDLDLSNAPLAGARGGIIRILIDGPTFYLRFPEGDGPGRGMGPGGRRWGKLDPANLDPSAEGFRLLLDRARSARPARSLALLTRARDVDDEGTEEIRGVDARRFTMTADIGEVAQHAPAPFAAVAHDLLEMVGAVTLSVEVWLGPDDLPRRIAYAVDSEQRQFVDRVTIDLFDYGTPVDRTLPPEAEVFDFTTLYGAGE